MIDIGAKASVPAPDLDMALEYFRVLFPEPGSIHFRGVKEPSTGKPDGVNAHYALDDDFPVALKGWLEYCDIDSRAAFVLPALVRSGGTKHEDVTALFTVLVDLDKGDTETSRMTLETALGPATMIVESGGTTTAGTAKMHLYWLLDRPARGEDIRRVELLRELLAEKFNGDPAFKQAAQVIRIPGSIHFKNAPRLVRTRQSNPAAVYSLDALEAAVRPFGALVAASKPQSDNWLDFSNVQVLREGQTERVLTQPIRSLGEDDVTRFEGAAIAMGHYIRQVREGRLTPEEAWEAVRGWNQATLRPPWEEDRLAGDFQRLIDRDVDANGPFVPAEPVVQSATPEDFSLLAWRADRFTGPAPDRVWLVQDMVPRSTAGMLAAVGDAGKSMLALNLALAVTTAPEATALSPSVATWLGHTVAARGAAVILTAEDDAAEVHRRLNALDPTERRKAAPLYVVPMIDAGGARSILAEGAQGPQPTEFWHALVAQLRAIPNLALVVIDPLSSFVGVDINKDNQGAAALMTMLGWLASQTGSSVMLVHHFAKGRTPTGLSDARDSVRGASALVDNGRYTVVLWEAEEKLADEVLEKLGRIQQTGKSGIIYQGGLAKGNAGNKSLRTLARNMTNGLLEDVTDVLRAGGIRSDELDSMVWEAIKAERWADPKFAFYTAKNDIEEGIMAVLRRRNSRLGNIGKLRITPILDAMIVDGRLIPTAARTLGKKILYEPDLSRS